MRQFRAILHRLRGLFRRRALEAEMQTELQAHLDGLTERNVAAGMAPDEARFAALRAFGGVAQVAERARDERRNLWLEQLGQDVRYAVRSLAKSPSFTITAVVTLALGIGVNTALFSVINLVALRPLPVKDPDNLVGLRGWDARHDSRSAFGYAEYLDYRDSNRTLDGLLAFYQARWSFESETAAQPDPERDGRGAGAVTVALVSENYFGVLGGSIQLGRGFLPEETRRGAAPVIVLSNLFWETRFHRDPEVMGRTLTLNGQVVTVIGVASAEFSGQEAVPPAGWLPLGTGSSRPADYEPGGPEMFGLIGRLKPGIGIEQAKADLDTIAARRAAAFPGESAKLSVRLERGLRFMNLGLTGKGARFIGLVVLGFGMVLMIACTNVTNLLLARGVARQPEIGVRLTLGASRGRIVRQLLTENMLLCVLGAGLGLALATWTLQALLPLVVSRLPVDWAMETRRVPFFTAAPDRRVLGFTALLTLGATLVAGLLPAWHASGTRLIATVRDEGTAFGRRLSASGLRKLLVVVQVAVSLTLLSCAGVLVRNLVARQSAEVGYDAHAVFDVILRPKASLDRVEEWSAAFRQALETLRDMPGVAASGMAAPAPLQGQMRARIRAAGDTAGATERQVQAARVSDGFFDTFKIPVLRGRAFHPHELHSTARVVMVSEILARELWPGQDAVGRTLARQEATGTFLECEVIGVVRDVMLESMHDERRAVYLPAPLDTWRGQAVFVRPHQVSAAALAEITEAAKAAGVELLFERRHSFWVEYFLLPWYGFAVVSGALGVLALGMASVGLYGLMAFSAHQRRREIGIRMALGASAKKVVRLFVRQGMRLVAVGLVLGLAGGALFAMALGKLMSGMLEVFDPVAFVAVTLLFALIGAFACWLPARRATKADPMVALRAE